MKLIRRNGEIVEVEDSYVLVEGEWDVIDGNKEESQKEEDAVVEATHYNPPESDSTEYSPTKGRQK